MEFKKLIVHEFMYTQIDSEKKFEHGWGFVPPIAATNKVNLNHDELVEIGNSLISEDLQKDFVCIGGIPKTVFLEVEQKAVPAMGLN